MNVSYINADLGIPVFGTKGASIHVQEVLRAFAKLGSSIDLFCTRPGEERPADFPPVRLHVTLVAKAAQPRERERAAIHANAEIGAAFAQAAQTRSPDLVYERYSLWSCAALEKARELRIPSVLEVNAPLIDEQSKHRVLVHRLEAEQIGARAFTAATVITTVSKQLAEMIGRHPAAAGKVYVVPNGVTPERFEHVVPTIERDSTGFVIAFVGTLKPWHGLSTLVDAFALVAERISGSRLLIIGDGPEREVLEQKINALGVPGRVRFTGAVSPEAIPGLLASADAAVAPYPQLDDFYFSPLKLYEYMAAGLPIVASRIGQVEEVISDEQTGVLVTPGDAYELADALCELAGAPDRRRNLAEAARERALRDHTWDGAVRRVLELAGFSAEAPLKR